VEFPLTCGLYGCYIISPPLVMLTEYHSQMFFSAMEQDTMQKNGTPSPPSGSVFNIAR
jgi:hypothetical protein